MPTFTELARLKMDHWNTRVHSPYARAYGTAYEEYQKVVSAVEAREKAQAEFFATVVSILSCSVGIAALGESWLHRLVVRTGLSTLGRSNTRTVANWIRAGQQHAVVGFVLGRVASQLSSVGTDTFNRIAGSLYRATANGLTETNPTNRYIELQELLTKQVDHLLEMAYAIEANRSLSVTQKAQATQALQQTGFWRPPENEIGKNALAKKIELAFYLNNVLAGDHFMVRFPPDMRTPPMRGGSIDVMPSDRQHYPQSERWSGQMGTYRTVEVDRPAREVQSKLQDLHQEILGHPFYESWWITRQVTSGRHDELEKAEASLNRLSAMTRPRNAMIVAF